MTPIVIDASAFAPLFLPDEAEHLIVGLDEALEVGGALVPQHWSLEVANLIMMALRRNRLDEATLPATVAIATGLKVEYDDQTANAAFLAAFDLAKTHNLTIYDSAYLELAMRKQLILATNDRRLAGAARDEGVRLFTT